MTDLAALGVSVDSDGVVKASNRLDGFEKSSDRAAGGATRVEKKSGALSKSLKRLAGVAAGAVAGMASLAGAVRTVTSGLARIDEQAKLAQSLETTTESIQVLTRAAELTGSSFSEIEAGATRLTRRLSLFAVDGGGPAAKAIEQLGLNAEQLMSVPLDQRLQVIARALDENATAAERAGLASRLFGERGFIAFNRLLESGVIEGATADIRDLGVAVSDETAAKVEEANDALSRLGLVFTAMGNEITATLAPALIGVAAAMTDAMREGSILRNVVDGIALIFRGFVVTVEQTVTGMNALTELVGGPALGAVAGLSAALIILRRNMIRTGIGALVVGAGALIGYLDRLVTATGGWGEALAAVGDVGKSVFLGVGRTAWGLSEILAGVASGITGSFVAAFSEIAKAWDALVNGMATAWNAIADTALGDQLGLGVLDRSDISGTLGGVADDLFKDAADSIKTGGQRIKDAGKGVSDAMANLRQIMNQSTPNTEESADAARKLANELKKLQNAADGGGSSGDGGSDGSGGVAGSMDNLRESLAGVFADAVTGAKSLKEGLSGILQQLAQMLANRAFQTLLSGGPGGLGGGGGGLLGLGGFLGFLDSGGTIGAGQSAIVGERRPEIVTGPARVIGGAETARMMQGGGSQQPQRSEITVKLDVPEGVTVEESRQIAGNVAIQVTQAGLRQNRKSLRGQIDTLQDRGTSG